MAGVTTFRVPQEGLEQYGNALDLMKLIKEIAHSSEVAKNIDSLSQKLSQAQELSDAKKKAAADAEEIIAQSKEFIDDFNAKQKAHEEKVKNDLKDIENKKNSLQNEQNNFATDKVNLQKSIDFATQQANEKLVVAQKLKEEALAHHKKAQEMEMTAAQRIKDHEDAVAEFEKSKEVAIDEHQKKLDEHEKSVQKLLEAQKAFEARKKRFDDALKE